MAERLRVAALAAGAGALFWLAFPPLGLWPLSFVGAGLLFAALSRSRGALEAAAAAFLMKLVFTLVVSPYLAGVGAWFPALYASALAGLWCGLGAAFHGLRRWRGEAAAVACLPALWTLFDRLAPALTFLPSEIPHWATAFGDSPARALAPWTGVYGLTFLAAAAVAAARLGWLARAAPERRAALRCMGLLAALALVPAALAVAQPRRLFPAARVRVATVGLGARWAAEAGRFDEGSGPLTPARRAEFKLWAGRRLEEVRRALPPGPVDLVLLPEDSLDAALSRDGSQEAHRALGLQTAGPLIEAYRDFARGLKTAVAVGLTVDRGGRPRNALLLIGPDGSLQGSYEKVRLMAGSEYWPLAGLGVPYWRLLGEGGSTGLVPFGEQYAPGEEPAKLLRLGRLLFGAPVCLEGQLSLRSLAWKRNGAGFLVFLSNAQWFRLDPVRYNSQVLSLLQVQAAAYGLPVALTGKAAAFGVVDAQGRAAVSPPVGSDAPPAARADEVLIDGRATAASRLGEYFLWLSAAALLVLPWAAGRR